MRSCRVCKKMFEPTGALKVFCSNKCKVKFKYHLDKDWSKVPRDRTQPIVDSVVFSVEQGCVRITASGWHSRRRLAVIDDFLYLEVPCDTQVGTVEGVRANVDAR